MYSINNTTSKLIKLIISDRLVGIRITDEFLKLTAHIDCDEDTPWSILYSEKYLNETFTKDMADRVTNMGLLSIVILSFQIQTCSLKV